MDNTPKFQIKAKEDWEYIRNLPPEFQLSSEERIILPTYANEINKLDKLKKQLDAIGNKCNTALNLFDKSELQEKYRIQCEKCEKQKHRLYSLGSTPIMKTLINRVKEYEYQKPSLLRKQRIQQLREQEQEIRKNNAQKLAIAKRNREKQLGITPETPFLSEKELESLKNYVGLLSSTIQYLESVQTIPEDLRLKNNEFLMGVGKAIIENQEKNGTLVSFFQRYKGIHRTSWNIDHTKEVINELSSFIEKEEKIITYNNEIAAMETAERTIERIQNGGLDLYRTIDVLDKDYDKSKSVIEESRYQEVSTINKRLSKIAKILLIVFFILAIPTTFLVNSFLRHEVQGLHTTCYITETGELDTSIKDEYFYAALIALGINLLLYIAVYIPTNKHHKKLISNINDTYSKKQKALLSEYSEKLKHLIYEIPIHLIVDAPEGTTFTNGLPNGDKYTVFLSENGKYYHSSRMCRGKWMNYSAHIFDLLNSRNPLSPCSNCLPPPYFGKPEWYVKYQHLHNLAIKYGISFVGDETK